MKPEGTQEQINTKDLFTHMLGSRWRLLSEILAGTIGWNTHVRLLQVARASLQQGAGFQEHHILLLLLL